MPTPPCGVGATKPRPAAACRTPKRVWKLVRKKMENRSKSKESDGREPGVKSPQSEPRKPLAEGAPNPQTRGAGLPKGPGAAAWEIPGL